MNNLNLEDKRPKVQVLKTHEVPGFTGVYAQAGESVIKQAALETKTFPHDNQNKRALRSPWQRENLQFAARSMLGLSGQTLHHLRHQPSLTIKPLMTSRFRDSVSPLLILF